MLEIFFNTGAGARYRSLRLAAESSLRRTVMSALHAYDRFHQTGELPAWGERIEAPWGRGECVGEESFVSNVGTEYLG